MSEKYVETQTCTEKGEMDKVLYKKIERSYSC